MVEKFGELKRVSETREEEVKKEIGVYMTWNRFKFTVKAMRRRMKEKDGWANNLDIAREIMEAETKFSKDSEEYREVEKIFHEAVSIVTDKLDRQIAEARSLEAEDKSRYFEVK